MNVIERLDTMREWALKQWTSLQTTPIPACDWDHLLILDSCRYDLFEETIEFRGDLSQRWAVGKSSSEFMDANFSKEVSEHQDIVYITANHSIPLNVDAFCEFVSTNDHWEPDIGTIPPEPVVDEGIEMAQRYPDKRIIVHLMQPHAPFVDNGQKLINSRGLLIKGVDEKNYNPDKLRAWEMIERGDVTPEEGWSAYRQCLQYGLREALRYHQRVKGKTVITSDHGRMFGERPEPWSPPEYGKGSYARPVAKVPWFVLPYEERRGVDVN